MPIRALTLLASVLLLSSAAANAQESAVQHALHGVDAPCVLQLPGSNVSPDQVLAAGDALKAIERTSITTTVSNNATFEVTYTGFTPAAQAAFQRAVDIWSTLISSSVTIRIDATFAPLAGTVLGSAGPRLIRNFIGAPISGTFYAYALADSRAGHDLDPNNADIQATFNSNFSSFHFGTDGNTPSNRFDFVSVVLHELGHGLGFVGSARVDDGSSPSECTGANGIGCWGYFTVNDVPQFFGSIVFDTFAEDNEEIGLLSASSYPNNSTSLGTLLRSSALFVNAPTASSANGGERPRLEAPSTFVTGSSYSHWSEGLYAANSENALMTPQIAPGESYTDIGPVTCGLFLDMGWSLGSSCTMLVPNDEAPSAVAGPSLSMGGSNPFSERTSIVVRAEASQTISVGLVDALGRRYLTELIVVGASREALFEINGAGLPSGTYFVRATDAAGRVRSLPLVRAR